MEGTTLVPAPMSLVGYEGIVPGVFVEAGIFAYPPRILYIVNRTDQDLVYSMDGLMGNNFVVPSQGFVVLDAGANRGTPQTSAFQGANVIFQTTVGDTAPTLGYTVVSYWYAD